MYLQLKSTYMKPYSHIATKSRTFNTKKEPVLHFFSYAKLICKILIHVHLFCGKLGKDSALELCLNIGWKVTRTLFRNIQKEKGTASKQENLHATHRRFENSKSNNSRKSQYRLTLLVLCKNIPECKVQQ